MSDDPRLYFENRSKAVLKLRETKQPNPYPHKFHVEISISAFIKKYESLGEAERAEEVVTVAGRLHNIRSQSKGLIFYDLHGEGTAFVLNFLGLKIQIMASTQDSERDFAEVHGLLQRGDIVGVRGFPGKSKRGELSIFPKVKILVYALGYRSTYSLPANSSKSKLWIQRPRNALQNEISRPDYEQ